MASLRICLGRATLRPCLDQTRQTLWTIQGTQGLHTSHAVYSNTAGQDAQESTDRTDRTAKQTSDLDLAALLDSSPEFKVDQSAEYYAERLLSPFSANSVGRTGVRDSLMPPQPSTSSSSQVVTPREIWLERQALQRMTPGSVLPVKSVLKPRDPPVQKMKYAPLPTRADDAGERDPFVALGLKPSSFDLDPKLLSGYVSGMGRFLPREKTGLTKVNQQRMYQLVKRARAMGLLSHRSKAIVQQVKGYSNEYA